MNNPISIEISLYKYGEFHEKYIQTFANEGLLFDYIQRNKDYSSEVIKQSKEFGENLSKWTESFVYNDVEYFNDVDL